MLKSRHPLLGSMNLKLINLQEHIWTQHLSTFPISSKIMWWCGQAHFRLLWYIKRKYCNSIWSAPDITYRKNKFYIYAFCFAGGASRRRSLTNYATEVFETHQGTHILQVNANINYFFMLCGGTSGIYFLLNRIL